MSSLPVRGPQDQRDHGCQQGGTGRLLEVAVPVDGRGDVPQPEAHGDQERRDREEWQTGIGMEAPAQHTERRGYGDHGDRTDGERCPKSPNAWP